MRIRTSLPGALALALLPLAGSCVAVAAGAAAGYVVSTEVLPGDVHTVTVADDVDLVWTSAKATLGSMSTTTLDVSEMPRVAKGTVDGAYVTLEVQAYDIDRTVVNVRAERYLTSRGAVAQRVIDRVLARLPGSARR
jgi:hypothetical protein